MIPKHSLKILHILDHSLPFHSGYAFRTQNIFRAQRKRGWEAVGLTSPEHDRILNSHGKRDEMLEGFLYYRSGDVSPGIFPLITAWRDLTVLTRRLHEVVKIEKPDLLHVHSPVLNAISALRVGRRLALPVVYEIRAFWHDAKVDHGIYAQDSWRYRLMQSLEMWACRKADQVPVLSHGLKDKLIEQGIPPLKLSVVSNGVNVDEFHACEPDSEYLHKWNLGGKQVIGFIGSFFRYEGLDLLVEAMAHLRITRPNIALLLVGGGKMEAKLKEQITQLGLWKTVVMPGRIPHDRIPGVYALIDILAYPRYSIRLTELVTPLKPLEAMAMGKALVASDTGGHRELIQHEHTGLLFPAGDVSALVKALTCLLDNRELRRKLERQGYDRVNRKYSWDMTTAVHSDLYARALAR